MTYAVRLAREAEHDLSALSRADQRLYRRLLRKIESLAGAPRAGKPLVGPHRGEFSLRVGAYRIVYQIQDSSMVVFVLTVKHRRHVY